MLGFRFASVLASHSTGYLLDHVWALERHTTLLDKSNRLLDSVVSVVIE